MPGFHQSQTTFYWALDSDGDPKLAQEKIESMFKHVAGVHSFEENSLFKACEHGPLDEDRRPYIPEDSQSMKKLKAAVEGKDKQNIKDLAHMTECMNTASLENWNSMVTLKYCRKTHSFGREAMFCRSAMGVIDANYNCQRQQAVTTQGIPKFRIKVDRGRRNFTVQKISQSKNEGWKEDIWAMVNYCAEVGVLSNVFLPESIPLKTRREAQHTKEEMIEQHTSRLEKKKR